jgi:formamidopyrimidine-DNA glycosylase
MAELPELAILAGQMHGALGGGTIRLIEARQEKCLNVPPALAHGLLPGRRVAGVTRRGKWLYIHLEPAYYLLINPGMGADIWYYAPGGELPEKYQFRLDLTSGAGFTCRFWWFGHIHLLAPDELARHKETAKLGPSPVEIDGREFAAIARRYPRSPVKSLLLDQEKLSGIGNAYAHDILWQAGLHPLRKLGSLDEEELNRYHQSIGVIVNRAIGLGGVEADFYRTGGNLNNWEEFMLIGYKAGKPCPVCGSPIECIKTGATKTYVCPGCQEARL